MNKKEKWKRISNQPRRKKKENEKKNDNDENKEKEIQEKTPFTPESEWINKTE